MGDHLNMIKKKPSRPSFELEKTINGVVCGIDEVGRGPLAGPVIAAALILNPNTPIELLNQINDSKKLSKKKHKYLYHEIKKHSIFALAEATVDEIDHINILQATMLAMSRAAQDLINQCDTPPILALVDGNRAPKLSINTQTVIKGDGKSFSIAASSIIAKYHRDQIMQKLAQQYPHYGWEKNAGYGTKQHMKALTEYGATPHHRKSFAPVREQINLNHCLY